MSSIRKLKQLYRRLPDLAPKDLDLNYCTIVPWSMPEVETIKALRGDYPLAIKLNDRRYHCQYSSPAGCSIWEHRPFYCRVRQAYRDQNDEQAKAILKEYFAWARKEGPIYLPPYGEETAQAIQELFGPGLRFMIPKIRTREDVERGKKAYTQMLATLAMVSGMRAGHP